MWYVLEKEKLYHYIHSVISSSTKNPKAMSISSVKVAVLLDIPVSAIEQALQEFVSEGRLKTAKLDAPPHHDVYFLE